MDGCLIVNETDAAAAAAAVVVVVVVVVVYFFSLFLSPLSLKEWFCILKKKNKKKTDLLSERSKPVHVYIEVTGSLRLS